MIYRGFNITKDDEGFWHVTAQEPGKQGVTEYAVLVSDAAAMTWIDAHKKAQAQGIM